MHWRPLRTNTDRNTGRGPPEQNRQRRPWRSWELWKPWRCRELRWPWRCWSSGGHGGAGSSGGHGGTGSSGGHGGAGSSGGHGRWSSGALASVPSARPLQPEPLLPPQKISLGKSGGIRSPPGLDTQNSTGQPSRARQTGQDSPQEPLPPPRQGGRRLKWPPWPQQEEPPAPDESPWTRHDKTR